MSIVYPLSMPTNKGPRAITFGYIPSIGVSSSPFSQATQVQVWSGDSWTVDITLPVMERANAEEWIAFILALNGREGTFLLGDPKGTTPRGTALGSPLLNGAHAAGATELVTDGWTASQTAALKVGDYLQLGQRLHKVVGADAESDGSGDATFDIRPRLREACPDNMPLLTTSCKGVFRLRDNAAQLYDLSNVGHYEMHLSAVEAF
jgi:hypothetical protein